MLVSRRRWIASAAVSPLLVAGAATRRKVVLTGGHPGDPECGCGGTVARLTARGDDVVILYLNRGEGYCGGEPLDRCGGIRSKEAEDACRILHARPLFANQYDGRAVLDSSHYDEFGQMLMAEEPDAVFAHWPIDRHRDHRAISGLVLDAFLKARNRFALLYYEVADDTLDFAPTEYVDISDVEATRRAACYAHASQQPGKWYPKQVEITRRRGAARGFAQAEAFFRVAEGREFRLP